MPVGLVGEGRDEQRATLAAGGTTGAIAATSTTSSTSRRLAAGHSARAPLEVGLADHPRLRRAREQARARTRGTRRLPAARVVQGRQRSWTRGSARCTMTRRGPRGPARRHHHIGAISDDPCPVQVAREPLSVPPMQLGQTTRRRVGHLDVAQAVIGGTAPGSHEAAPRAARVPGSRGRRMGSCAAGARVQQSQSPFSAAAAGDAVGAQHPPRSERRVLVATTIPPQRPDRRFDLLASTAPREYEAAARERSAAALLAVPLRSPAQGQRSDSLSAYHTVAGGDLGDSLQRVPQHLEDDSSHRRRGTRQTFIGGNSLRQQVVIL